MISCYFLIGISLYITFSSVIYVFSYSWVSNDSISLISYDLSGKIFLWLLWTLLTNSSILVLFMLTKSNNSNFSNCNFLILVLNDSNMAGSAFLFLESISNYALYLTYCCSSNLKSSFIETIYSSRILRVWFSFSNWLI